MVKLIDVYERGIFEDLFVFSYWEVDRIGGDNLYRDVGVLIIVKFMFVVGFFYGGRIRKKRGFSIMYYLGFFINVSRCFIRRERNLK